MHDSALLQSVATILKIPAENVPQKVEAMAAQIKDLQKQVKTADGRRQAETADGRRQTAEDLIQNAETIGNVKFIACELPDTDLNAARQLVDQIKQKTESVAMLFALTPEEGKITLLAGASRDLVGKYDALELVRRLSPLVGGKGGGGRPDMAQSGGNDASKLPEVFAEAKKYFG
jgi:alanyl-tRNA synthetase